MSTEKINAEEEALRSLLEWIQAATRTKELYERAGMSLPEPLRRFFGISEEGAKAKVVASVPGPARRQPPEVKPGWISVDVREAGPPSLTLAVLRSAGKPLAAKGVAGEVLKLQPTTTTGTIANVGTKLQTDGLIDRGEDGWSLRNASRAPLLFEGRLWGDSTIFGKYELAAHRRDAILHLLGVYRSGLQTSQIIEQLRACPWVHATITKETVQDDIEILDGEKKIRRRGPSKKWELAPEEKRT